MAGLKPSPKATAMPSPNFAPSCGAARLTQKLRRSKKPTSNRPGATRALRLNINRGECFVDHLKKFIRTVPDFPKPGIMFYDITTLLKDSYGLRTTIDRLVECIDEPNIDTVIGIEARGFIFAPALAYRLKAGF